MKRQIHWMQPGQAKAACGATDPKQWHAAFAYTTCKVCYRIYWKYRKEQKNSNA